MMVPSFLFLSIVRLLLVSMTTTASVTATTTSNLRRNTASTISQHYPHLVETNATDEAAVEEAEEEEGYVASTTRYIVYSNLTEEQLDYVTVLNYTEDTWNILGTNMIEYSAFFRLQGEELEAATNLGFTGATWDCEQNHYMDYDWSELVTYDIDTYWNALGWNQSNWEEGGEYPVSVELYWDNLTVAEQDGATGICYFKESWDAIDMKFWNCYDDNYEGFSWKDLEQYDIDQYWTVLGWNMTTWDNTTGNATAPVTSSLYWSNLTQAQQDAATNVCYDEDLWDRDFDEESVLLDSDENAGRLVEGAVDKVETFFENAWQDIVAAVTNNVLDEAGA